MPALSPTMTEGTLAKWLKKEGDTVEAGDIIAEIETDKATMEVEAVDEGTLGKILVEEGSANVPVNQVIGLLLEEGEDSVALDKAVQKAASAPNDKQAEKDSSSDQSASAKNTNSTPSSTPQAPGPVAKSSAGNRIFASPLAKRLAAEEGLDISTIQGSGPHGRVVKSDIEQAKKGGVAQKSAAQSPAAAQAAPSATGPGARQLAQMFNIPHRVESVNNMRKTIAKRLTESKQSVPHFYLSISCELDNLLALRKDLNVRAGEDIKISVNDMLIKAAAVALKKVPAANASWDEQEGIVLYERVDISVAVATDGGLITPIIKNAEHKGFAEISHQMKDLAGRARAGKLKPEEYQGGTFSLSNLGMFGIEHFDAIINPPQGCILAVGAGKAQPVVKDNALAIATVMKATLSVDHRVVDGAVGAEYLAAFKALVEDPLSILL